MGGSYNPDVNNPHEYDPTPPDWSIPAPPTFRRRMVRALGEVVQTILIAVLLFLGVNTVTARIRVEGNSMEPSLHDGEFVVVNRLAYRVGQPERGDIVVFHPPFDPERRFIKRIIGLPGDMIQVLDGTVYVNGESLREPYILATPNYSGEWTVGQDEIFVLGDNRNNSNDSQNWGAVARDQVIGKAVVVYWPLTEIGTIPHYDLASASN